MNNRARATLSEPSTTPSRTPLERASRPANRTIARASALVR